MKFLAALLATLALLGLGLYAFSPGSASPIPAPTDLATSAVAKSLADKVAPVLVADVTARKEEIIRSAGGLPARTAVRLGFPTAVREIPKLTEVGVGAMLGHLGSMTGPEILTTIHRHNQSIGRRSHPSIIGAEAPTAAKP